MKEYCPTCEKPTTRYAGGSCYSCVRRKLWKDPERRAKMSAAMLERWEDPEYRAKMSAAMLERWEDPEHRAKVSAARALQVWVGGRYYGTAGSVEEKEKIYAHLRKKLDEFMNVQNDDYRKAVEDGFE